MVKFGREERTLIGAKTEKSAPESKQYWQSAHRAVLPVIKFCRRTISHYLFIIAHKISKCYTSHFAGGSELIVTCE